MHIKRVIKFYLYFVLLITAFALLNQNTEVNKYFASVTHSIDEWGKEHNIDPYRIVGNIAPPADQEVLQWKKDSTYFISDQDSATGVHFEIFNRDGNSFALPGDRNAYVMTFRLKTTEKPLRLSTLIITPQISNIDDIPYASLKVGEDLIPYSEMKDGAFVFKGLDINLPENSQKEIDFLVDVNPYLSTGNRIRFDILSPDHIKLEIGGKPYSLKEYYPLSGEYLTVVGIKPQKPEESET